MEIRKNEPMKNHTSFKIGGNADEFCEAHSKEDVCRLIDYANDKGIPYTFIGNGSNILVGDGGVRGLVVKLARGFDKITVDGCEIVSECGALLSKLAAEAYRASLTGLEFASGIPGTLGGGIYMNAGAYGGELKDVIKSVTYLENGVVSEKTAEELDFGYRKSFFTDRNAVILSAVLSLKKGNAEEIKALADEYRMRRTSKQPLNFPSAGSTFKRPDGYFAGKLIEDAGLKGYKIGGARVSEKHSGFIINTGNATAADVIALIKHIQSTVAEKFGVELKTEVKMLGEF